MAAPARRRSVHVTSEAHGAVSFSVINANAHEVAREILGNRSVARTGIPILSDIPIPGALFSQHNNTARRTELFVLSTPRILRDAKDARDATDELRERMRTLTPLDHRAR